MKPTANSFRNECDGLDKVPTHARALATYSVECACGAKHSCTREVEHLDFGAHGYLLRNIFNDAYRRGWRYGGVGEGDRWRCCYCVVANQRARARSPITGDPIRTALERE